MEDGTHTEQRETLRGILLGIEDLVRSTRHASAARSASALRAKLSEQRFNVAVVGEFKRGKSTLVNAILGAEVLPAAVVPLTSVVTAVTWGSRPGVEVTFADGRTEDRSIGELTGLVTEHENPQNRLGIQEVLVSYPAEELRDGVHIVDTPGVGSVYEHNTEAALAFVPESDVAVFVTSVDPPISNTERAFLERVRADAARMIFVLNKMDYLRPQEVAEALEFTRRVLTETLEREVEVYPMSARRALEARMAGDPEALRASGFAQFMNDFHQFLLREKGAVFLESIALRTRKLLTDERNSSDVEEHALALPELQLAELAHSMERIFADARQSREDIRRLLRAEVETVMSMVESDLAHWRHREEPVLVARAGQAFATREDIRDEEGLDALIAEVLRPAIGEFRIAEERRVAAELQRRTTRFVQQTNELIEQTVRLCSELLAVDLEPAAIQEGVSGRVRFSYAFGDDLTMLDVQMGYLKRLLTRGQARRLLEKRLREEIPRLLDKHSGRMRWDFSQRLLESRVALERDLNGRLEDTIESLHTGIERAQAERASTSASASVATARVAERRREIDRLIEELTTIELAQEEPTEARR